MFKVINFTPQDAFNAVILDDGTISINEDMADPKKIPTIIVDFVITDELALHQYYGIYHFDFDQWEFSDTTGIYRIANLGDRYYDYAMKTVKKFIVKLSDGPNELKLIERYNILDYFISASYSKVDHKKLFSLKSKLIAEKTNVKVN